MSQFVHPTGMKEDIIVNTLRIQEDQILNMRRELNGIHASITDVEKRVNKTRVLMMTGIGLLLVIMIFGLNLIR